MNSPGVPASITGSLQICVIHENFQGSNNQRAKQPHWEGDPVGPSQSTMGIVDAALCTAHSCTSLGKKTPGFTAPWASQEHTGRKTDCCHPGWLHTLSVTRSSSHSVLCFHYALWLIFLFTNSTKMPHFGLTSRQQINHGPSGRGMETGSPKS